MGDDKTATVPLTVIGGWLGAGKTTIINKIMSDMIESKLRVALVQNEFSNGSMDKAMLTDPQSGQVFENFVELAEGCICCSVKSDFINALDKLLSMCRFDYILLECSGLADPGEIASILWTDEALQIPVHLDGIITVLDGAHLLNQLTKATPDESACLHRQIAYADRLVLTKIDTIDDQTCSILCDRVNTINPTAPVVRSVFGDIAYGQIINLRAYSLTNLSWSSLSDSSCAHDHSIGAVVLGPFSQVSIDLDQLDRWLGKILWDRLDDNPIYPWVIFRIKGIVYNHDNSNIIHVQAVQNLFDREPGSEWTHDPFTKLVLIGRNLDYSLLQQGLLGCTAAPSTRQIHMR